MCKSFFFPYSLLYGPCIICVYFVKFFFGLSAQYFEKIFVCGFIILFLCCSRSVVAAFSCMFCIFMTCSTYCCCRYKLTGP
jgi:hypothetical protein